MRTYEIFKEHEELMGELAAKQGQHLRIEVQGIDAVEILHYRQADVIVVHGFDAHNVETLVVMPAGHFSASLSIVPKQRQKQILGFKTPTPPTT